MQKNLRIALRKFGFFKSAVATQCEDFERKRESGFVLGYEFIRHCAGRRMDKLLTIEGGIGCRRLTWEDPEVNEQMPFYRELEKLHAGAREIPANPTWPKINRIIEQMVMQARSGHRPLNELLREADEQAARAVRGATS